MTPKERIELAYKVTERMKLMPFLKEEIEAVLFSLYLVRQEDL
jgi:hypothetical protein